MALRFSAKNTGFATTGTAFAHGLSTTPDEWFFNVRTTGIVLYLSAVGTTSIAVGTLTTAGVGDVFCSIEHSIIQ